MQWSSEKQHVGHIATRLRVSEHTVRRWIARFNHEGLSGLNDEPRTGRPCTYNADEISVVVATALTKPDDLALPFGHWTLDRLDFMHEDAQASILLTLERFYSVLPGHDGHRIGVDSDWGMIAGERDGNPVSSVSALNTVAVIYTSGSTGKPKGAALTHRGLVNHTTNFIKHYELQPSDRVLQFCALGFDTMAEELFPALDYRFYSLCDQRAHHHH